MFILFFVEIIALSIGLSSCRQINGEGLNLVKHFEGWRPNFYKDSVGIQTIGYGHACHASDCSTLKPPLSIAQGEELLRKDLSRFESCVEKNAPGINDNQFAALVSFSYNLGCGALQQSTLLKHVKSRNYKAAANEFPKFVHAGGKVLAGLVRRRNDEKNLFCKSGGC